MTASASPGRRTALGLVLAAGLLLAAGGRLAAAPAAVLAAVALAWTPGALLVARAGLFDGAATRAAAALALSPFLTALPWAALRAAGAAPEAASRAVLVALVVAGLAALARPARAGSPPAPRLTAPELAPALAWTAVVAALLFGNPALAPRSDGWFHAGVVWQVAERALPPEDPYFAGLPLLYFWGSHAWAALALTAAPALGVWTPLILANLAAAAAVLLAIAGLARALGGTPAQAGWAAGLAVVGWTPFGWLQLAGRAVSGDVRGWAELQRLLDAGVDPVLVMLASGQLHASMAFHGDKSLVLTPFGIGLALFALGVTLSLGGAGERRRVPAFAVVTAAALFLHTVAGHALVLSAALWAAASLMRRLRGQTDPSGHLRLALVAVPLAVLPLLPYLVSITAGKQGQVGFAAEPAAVRTALLGTGVFLAGAALWWRRPRPGAEPALLAAALFLALGLSTRLTESNQSKFFNLLATALAAPAALGLHGWVTRAVGPARLARAALLLAVLLPTPAVALWAFAAERGQAAGSWHEPSHEARGTFVWARSHTAPATVFADLGGARELFTLTGRSVLWGGRDGERDWGHAPALLETRRRTVRALCTGEPPDAEGAALLRALGRPVVVVARRSHPETAIVRRLAGEGRAGYRLLRDGQDVALARWEPVP